MTGYTYGTDVPAIRTPSQASPWRCPWCGSPTWFVSEGDDTADLGRVEMYCDNEDCDSRETVVLVMKGFNEEYTVSADARADVRALRELADTPYLRRGSSWRPSTSGEGGAKTARSQARAVSRTRVLAASPLVDPRLGC